MPSKIYIHYGDSIEDLDSIKIGNGPVVLDHGVLQTKPARSFWASPKSSPMTWKEWCKNNLDRSGEYWSKAITFRVPVDKIASISDRVSFLYFFYRYGSWWDYDPKMVAMDFERMREDGWYGFEVLISKWKPLYRLFYGYDCDSIAIWDKRGIIPTRRQP